MATKTKSKSSHGGPRPGSGRPPKAAPEERDAIARAREKLRSALPELADIMLSFARDPSLDFGLRIRAIEFAGDRSGLPKQTQVESASASAALGALLTALAGDMPSDLDDPPPTEPTAPPAADDPPGS